MRIINNSKVYFDIDKVCAMNIENKMIQQRLQDTDDAMDEWLNRNIDRGISTKGLSKLSSKLWILYLRVRAMLKTSWDKNQIKDNPYKTLEDLEEHITSNEEKEVMKAYKFLDDFIYSKGITKTDTREKHDRTDIFAMNHKSLGT